MRDNEELPKPLAEIGALIMETPDQQPIAGAKFVNYADCRKTHCLNRPLACLTVQGRKLIQACGTQFELEPGVIMVAGVDTPSSSVLLDASLARPYVAICIDLDRRILADILAQAAKAPVETGEAAPSLWLMHADAQILDAFARLARLLRRPDQAPVLAPLIIRELHFLLLSSQSGGNLRSLYMCGGRDSRIIDVISWLKRHLGAPVPMEELARMAHMSVSSFHRHFKTISGFSPLQYHKNLRLYEAQRLMLAEDLRVAEAALSVGYESVTQFNREYRRLFGEAPGRHVTGIRRRLKKGNEREG